MLVNLHVRNMALIEEADIDLTGGLTILTGETGAGKSIIIGSVNAALGGKVSADIIRKGAEYALAELTFHVDDDNRLKCLKELGVEDCDGGDVIISRRIMPSRSVIKVNGVTVTAAFVRKMASLLIDIHGQHEHQSLLDEERHLELVDRFLDDDARRIKAELASAYAEYDRLRKHTLSLILMMKRETVRRLSLLMKCRRLKMPHLNREKMKSLRAHSEE